MCLVEDDGVIVRQYAPGVWAAQREICEEQVMVNDDDARSLCFAAHAGYEAFVEILTRCAEARLARRGDFGAHGVVLGHASKLREVAGFRVFEEAIQRVEAARIRRALTFGTSAKLGQSPSTYVVGEPF